MSAPGVYEGGFSKHRLEALTDGIFAVAMTLLVIELKIPESAHIKTQADLLPALGHLIPKFISWLISFFVLAIFWVSHHRLFSFLKYTDRRLLIIVLAYLGFVSFMPFCSALTGEYGGALVSQLIYSFCMCGLGVLALIKSRYIFQHPELCHAPVPRGVYVGARIRTLGLIAVAVVSVIITAVLPGYGAIGNMAFMLMAVFGGMGRRAEARERAADLAAQNSNSTQS